MADITDPKILETQANLNILMDNYISLKKQVNELEDKTIEKMEVQRDLNDVEIEILKKEITLKKQLNEDASEHRRILQEKIESQKQFIELLQEQKKLLAEVETLSRNFAEDISESLGIVQDLNQSGFGRMLTLIEKSGNALRAVNNVAQELSQDLNKRIALSIIENSQEMLLTLFQAVDSVGASLQKAIPNGRTYTKIVEDMAANSKDVFLTTEQLGESMISLNSKFTEFNKISDPEKMKLVELSTTLEKLGVDTDTFAENTNFLVKSLGYSTDQVVGFQEDLNKLAQITKINLGTLNSNFLQANKQLAAFGKTGALKIFTQMTKASKALGIEMNRLLDIAGGFDTFESAAEAAGSLNSVLGGNVINTIDLMNASLDSPVEVFKQFKTALDRTGKSFDSMTPAMRKMVAETMRMDVDELAKLSSVDLETAVAQMEAEAAATESMKDQAKLAQPVIEKLTTIMYKFLGVISPMVDGIHSFVDWLANLVENNTLFIRSIGKWLPVLGAAAFGLMVFGKAAIFVRAVMMAFGGSGIIAPLLGKGVTAATGPALLTKVGTAATASAKGFLSLGAAALMLGAGVAIAAYGIAQFVKSFQGMSPEQIVAVTFAIGVFTLGLGALIFILSKMAPAAAQAGIGLLPLGLAVGLIGAAVGIAAWGMSKLVLAFVEFMNVADVEKLMAAAAGITALSISFSALAASFVAIGLASPALFAFATAVRLSLTDTVIEKLQKVAQYVSLISVGLENMKADKISALASAASGIDISGTNAHFNSVISESRGISNRPNIVVQIPGETINVEIKSPVMLDGDKIGNFVQEQIIKREDRQVVGVLKSAVGIKTGKYND